MSLDYFAIWPIADRNRRTDQLISEAVPVLVDMLEDAGLVATGDTSWGREVDRLTARVPVIAEFAVAGSARPDQSREAQADEWFDGWAA